MKYKIFLSASLLSLISGSLEAQRGRATSTPDRITNMDLICSNALVTRSYTLHQTQNNKQPIRSENLNARQRGFLEPVYQPVNRILAPPQDSDHQTPLARRSKEVRDMMLMSLWIARIVNYTTNPVLYNMSVTSKTEVNLYHVFLAGLTEIGSLEDQPSVSFIDSAFFNILKELGVLEDFQYFLLERLGFHHNDLGPFEARPNGGFILDERRLLDDDFLISLANIQLNEDVTNMMNRSSMIREIFTSLQDPAEQENPTLKLVHPSHLFAAVLNFENPIREFLLDRLTDPSTFSERNVERSFDSWPAYQRRITDLRMRLFPILISQITNTNYNFDIDSFINHLSSLSVLREGLVHQKFLEVLRQGTFNESESYLAFNGHSQFGKIISIETNQEQPSSLDIEHLESWSDSDEPVEPIFTGTVLLIEALDGKRYTYYYIYDGDGRGLLYTPDIISEYALNPIYFIDNIQISGVSKNYFQQFYRSRASHNTLLNPFSINTSANHFRAFFNALNHSPNKINDLQNNEQRFISYINAEKERVPGQIIEVSSNGVVIKSLNGQTVTIEDEEQLNTIWQDVPVESMFEQTDIDLLAEDRMQIIRENREGQFDTTQIEMSGDPAKDAFRRGLIAGVLEGDQRFISFEDYDSERVIAKVVAWDGDNIIFQVYKSTNSYRLYFKNRRLSFGGTTLFSFWNSVNVSQAAKDYFVRIGDSQDNDIHRLLGRTNTSIDISDEYYFLSQTSTEMRGEIRHLPPEVVDWTDPSLKRWMRKATDLIEEKTGIRPGPQELNANQRSEIYRVWFHDIVPLIEDPSKGNYGYLRTMVNHVHHQRDRGDVYFPQLGHILDIKAAVCAELSNFGVLLFSEYGLQTKLMNIDMLEFGEYGHAWIKVHGDGFVEFIDSNGKAKTAHTDLRFLTKEHYPQLSNLTDEQISSLIKEINLVDPPSM